MNGSIGKRRAFDPASPMTAGVELGGTKTAVALGSGPDDLCDPIILPTRDPQTTMQAVAEALHSLAAQHGPFGRLGVASFGPLHWRADDPRGQGIGKTPKPLWAGFNPLAALANHFSVPQAALALDTDVNAAALAEGLWGQAQGLADFAYVTVGTGIGAGLVVNGRLLHGGLHPEAGHLWVRRDPALDPFMGLCPFHGDCLEGLASGPALAARLGVSAEKIADNHPIWDLVGDYLGQLCLSLLLVASPRRIIMGGGVGAREPARSKARLHLERYLAGYVEVPDAFILAPALGSRAGVLGAIALTRL
jgi:fructokinase